MIDKNSSAFLERLDALACDMIEFDESDQELDSDCTDEAGSNDDMDKEMDNEEMDSSSSESKEEDEDDEEGENTNDEKIF